MTSRAACFAAALLLGFASHAAAQVCPSGKYSGDGMEPCADCPAGSYNADLGATFCPLCEPGKYSPVPGSTLCFFCDAGYFSASPGSSSCQACPPGTYTINSGSTECTPCSEGSYSPFLGSISCNLCPQGFFSSGPGNSFCTACPPGTYAASPGSNSCTPCPAGSFNPDPASGSCSPCPDGFIAPGTGSAGCQECPPGMTSNETHTECVAITGLGAPRAVQVAYVRQSIPNPATRLATIEFGLPARAVVRIGIYDLSGRMIRTLVDERLEAGVHHAAWDLRAADGSLATSGVYFYRMSAGPYRAAKVLVVRSR